MEISGHLFIIHEVDSWFRSFKMAAKEDQDDVDNIDFANYKGIYAEEESDTKYTCPVTGAHFEFNDVCKRLAKVLAGRKRMEE